MNKSQLPKMLSREPNPVLSRRAFIQAGATSSLLATAGGWLGGCDTARRSTDTTDSARDETAMPVIDYGLSFISGKVPWNRVRFWVESHTRILDERSGETRDYYQCASCKSENTFARKDLFMEDNYDFLPIFGPDDAVVFRRKAYLNPRYREWRKAGDFWGGQTYQLKIPRSSRLLLTTADIRQATAEALPLVAQTEISQAKTGLRAIIEYPVKTINIRDEEPTYQVDTGPVAFPDLSRRHQRWADGLSLAFVAFNAPHFADFVIEDETPINRDDQEITRVHHYSRILSLPAQNRVFAIEG